MISYASTVDVKCTEYMYVNNIIYNNKLNPLQSTATTFTGALCRWREVQLMWSVLWVCTLYNNKLNPLQSAMATTWVCTLTVLYTTTTSSDNNLPQQHATVLHIYNNKLNPLQSAVQQHATGALCRWREVQARRRPASSWWGGPRSPWWPPPAPWGTRPPGSRWTARRCGC